MADSQDICAFCGERRRDCTCPPQELKECFKSTHEFRHLTFQCKVVDSYFEGLQWRCVCLPLERN